MFNTYLEYPWTLAFVRELVSETLKCVVNGGYREVPHNFVT